MPKKNDSSKEDDVREMIADESSQSHESTVDDNILETVSAVVSIKVKKFSKSQSKLLMDNLYNLLEEFGLEIADVSRIIRDNADDGNGKKVSRAVLRTFWKRMSDVIPDRLPRVCITLIVILFQTLFY